MSDYLNEGELGVTLRDFFAAHALTGLLAQPGQWGDLGTPAKLAYETASAMLAERQRLTMAAVEKAYPEPPKSGLDAPFVEKSEPDDEIPF
jgi:hypothetical protein